jgi:hypothetical protein
MVISFIKEITTRIRWRETHKFSSPASTDSLAWQRHFSVFMQWIMDNGGSIYIQLAVAIVERRSIL